MNNQRIGRPMGFTLLEILIILGVIAILTGLALPRYKDYTDRAKASAFILQTDAWREKFAVECATNPTTPPDIEQRVLGIKTPAPFNFSGYTLDLAWRELTESDGTRRFIVVALANAASGPEVIPIARQIRVQLQKNGTHYVKAGADIDYPSVQGFAVDIGACAKTPASQPAVSTGTIQPAKPATPQPPAVLAPSPTIAASAPATPPIAAAAVQSNTPSAGNTNPNPVSCASNQRLSPDGRSCIDTSCTGGRSVNASGQCVCPGHQHFNASAGKCVGNLH